MPAQRASRAAAARRAAAGFGGGGCARARVLGQRAVSASGSGRFEHAQAAAQPSAPEVVLHHADVAAEDRAWFGAVPVTTPRRTLSDCAKEGLSPEVLGQAARQALRRGLVARSELAEVERALEPFGGIGT